MICVGNLVVGGAGKTPTALEVASVCRKLGAQAGLPDARLSRQRKRARSASRRRSIRAADVGDEALLLAQFAPTVVAADRPSGAKLLASLGVDVVVMDDGFQNPSLNKDLTLVVVDGERGIGNGLVFPAGPLRAPLAAQIRSADALVVLGEGSGGKGVQDRGARRTPDASRTHRAGAPPRPEAPALSRLRRHRRSGEVPRVARPRPARSIGHTMNFPDHHLFTDAECEAILAEAKSRDLVPITTEKDRVRLNGRGERPRGWRRRRRRFRCAFASRSRGG